MSKTISVPIAGIDRATPDHIVQDGKCETLTNLRYRNGAWRNIKPPKQKVEIVGGSIKVGKEIHYGNAPVLLYKHPQADGNKYIAALNDLNTMNTYDARICSISLATNDIAEIYDTAEELITIADGLRPGNVEVTHFGNVLIITDRAGGSVPRQYYFTLIDDKYHKYQTPKPAQVTLSVDNPYGMRADSMMQQPDAQDLYYSYWDIINVDNGNILKPAGHPTDNRWWGELAYIVCYLTTDGKVIAPSAVGIISSDNYREGTRLVKVIPNYGYQNARGEKCFGFVAQDENPMENFPADRLTYILPKLTVTPDKSVDPELIDRVAVFATQIHSIYDYEGIIAGKLGGNFSNPNFIDCYADNKLLDKPFYLVEEKRLKDFNGSVTFELDYYKLSNHIFNKVYEPNQSLHTISGEALYSYNERLHIANLSTTYFDGYSWTAEADDRDSYAVNTVIHKNSDFLTATKYYDKQRLTMLGAEQRVISYPSADAVSMSVYVQGDTSPYGLLRSYTLLAAPAIDIAYYMPAATNEEKFPAITLPDTAQEEKEQPVFGHNLVNEGNHIQVSAQNNCFVLPYRNRYTVGNDTERIMAINSTVGLITDSAFGTTPLYVLTDKSVWALIQGTGEVLYGNTFFINDHHTVSHTTLAAGGYLFYFTESGLMALAGRRAERISAPLDFSDGRPIFVSGNFGLSYDPIFEELTIYSNNSNSAFIFSLTSNVWSSKTLTSGVVDGEFTYYIVGELLCRNIHIPEQQATRTSLYYLYEEDSTPSEKHAVVISTRPLKLGSLSYKRIEEIVARIRATAPVDWTLCIYLGSNSATPWHCARRADIAQARNDIGMRRVSNSAQMAIIELSANINNNADVLLTNFDVAAEERFASKLR